MMPSAISGLIQTALPEARVSIEGEGCSFSVVVISDAFAGLPLVKRQQRVLQALSQALATGDLHAITVKAHTPDEWERQQNAHR